MNNIVQDRAYTYRRPQRPQYRRRKRQKRNTKFPKFVFLLLLFIGCIYLFSNLISKIDFNFPTANKSHSSLDLNFNFLPRRQNILIMGVDVAENSNNPFKGNRSDTMLLVSIAPYGRNINVISIPRDSKVYIPGKGKADKINHAFAFGGARLSVRTVEEVFGVKINNYLAVSNEGVIKMIDALGGLPIYIEKNMKYDDYTAKLHINLKEGNHILSGRETEGYLRFRHDSYGDIGRIKRQQWFFNALIARLKDPTVIVKLPELLKILPDYIQTDLSGYELAKYLGIAKNIDISTIQIATIPGAPSTRGIVSYWIIDPIKTQELINNLVYRNRTDVDLTSIYAGIAYTPNRAEDAIALKQELEALGLQVKMQTSANLSKDIIAVHNLDVAGETINDIKKTATHFKDIHTVYDPIGLSRVSRDISIVLSGK